MSKFTPRPWSRDHFSVLGSDNSVVANIVPWDVSGCREEDHANTNLIAAAPDLYAVLNELEESVEYWSEYDVPLGIVDRIKAALAKARGEK